MNTGMSALFQIIVSFTYIPRVGFLDHIVALLLVSVRKLHSVSSCCYCCCSVAKSCETVHDPVDCSTPGFPVPHNLPEFVQIHVHWVNDTIQSFHPLLFPSSLAFNLSSASGSFPMSQFFSSGGQSIGVSASASVLPMNIQDWSPLRWTGWIFLHSKGLSRVFSNTTVQKHQFFSAQLSL